MQADLNLRPWAHVCLTRQNTVAFEVDLCAPDGSSPVQSYATLNLCYLIASSYQDKTIKWRKRSKPAAYLENRQGGAIHRARTLLSSGRPV